jgi:hypothetical protein
MKKIFVSLSLLIMLVSGCSVLANSEVLSGRAPETHQLA